MDVISRILDSLKLSCSFYFDTRFETPWGVRVPAYKQVARFHYVAGGSCWVQVADGGEPVQLQNKDFVLIPHGNCHVICSDPKEPVVDLDEALIDSGYQGEGSWCIDNNKGGELTQLICGHFEFNENFQHPLIRQLPDMLLVRKQQTEDFAWFASALKVLTAKTYGGSLGHAAIVRHLTEIVFILLIKIWSESQDLPEGFLKAIQDSGVGQSLEAFHNQPGDNWSVAKLAHCAGMSRTAYAEQFKALSGISPMRYVMDWRIQCAGQLLLETQLSMEQIAEQVGYRSVPAFARAFKQYKGVGPGSYRRNSLST